MQSVSEGIAKRFAQAFCYGKKGYSLEDLRHLFPSYGMQVPDLDLGMLPAKVAFFCTCLSSLSPGQQRQFLYDLCDSPPPASHALPSEGDRVQLLRQLAQADGVSPLGVELSSLTLHAARQQWFTAASRIADSPSSSLTAARTLLESTCKTILNERGKDPNGSGKLDRLFKQTTQALGIRATEGAGQAAYQVINGLVQCVNGLAAVSNLGGDRHGLVGGERITDHSLAALVVHAAGTVSLFIIQVHRSGLRTDVVA